MSAQFRIIPLIDKIFKIRAQKIELQHSYIVHHFNLQYFECSEVGFTKISGYVSDDNFLIVFKKVIFYN